MPPNHLIQYDIKSISSLVSDSWIIKKHLVQTQAALDVFSSVKAYQKLQGTIDRRLNRPVYKNNIIKDAILLLRILLIKDRGESQWLELSRK